MKTVVIDLTPLRPGGENGGVKPLILESLSWLKSNAAARFRFVYLTASLTHDEVCRLARPEDRVVCILKNSDDLPEETNSRGHLSRAIPYSPKLLADFGADVFYAPFGSVANAGETLPVLALIVDLLHRDFPHTLAPADIANREKYFRETVARASRFQCITHYVIDRLHECYAVPRENCFATYIIIQNRIPLLPAEAPPADLALPPAGPFFYYPANFWVHKNHEALIIAYGAYYHGCKRDGETPWPLVLTGHLCERSALIRRYAEDCGVAGAVIFAGHLKESELVHVWNRAGAMVFPSLHEGFGIPLLEAMRFGVPVISGDACSLPEVGGDACLYANARKPGELADAMRRLAGDASLREEYARRGLRRLKELSWDAEMRRLADQLESACFESAGAPAEKTGNAGCPLKGGLSLHLPPGDEPARLRLRFADSVPGTSVSVTVGDRPFGSIRTDLEQETPVEISLVPAGETLRLAYGKSGRKTVAESSGPAVRILSVELLPARGESLVLYPQPSA